MSKRLFAAAQAVLTAAYMLFSVAPVYAAEYEKEPEAYLVEQKIVMQPDCGPVQGEVIQRERGRKSSNTKSAPMESTITLKGEMPEGIYGEAVTVDPNDYIEPTLLDIICAYDISLYEKEMKYEPEGSQITVSVTAEQFTHATEEKKDLVIVHIPDSPADPVQYITDYTLSDGTLTFMADSFSVYMIIDNGVSGEANIRVKDRNVYHYLTGDKDENGMITNTPYMFNTVDENGVIENGQVSEQIVKDGDILQQPTLPPMQNGLSFLGWYIIAETDGESDGPFDWPDSDHLKRAKFGEPVTVESDNVHYYLAPLYQEYRILVFHDEDSVITRKMVILSNEGGQLKADALISDVKAKDHTTTHKFYAWKYNAQYGGRTVPVFDAAGNAIEAKIEITREEFPLPVYLEIHLYPEYKESRWLNFDPKGGSYLSPLLIRADEVTNQVIVTSEMLRQKKPTYSTHRFLGWYLDDTYQQQLTDENGNLVSAYADGYHLDGDKTLYAKWDYQEVEYRYLFWEQIPTDALGTPEDQRNYSFMRFETHMGMAGEGNYTPEPVVPQREGFTIRVEEPQQIMEDGSTVVNVYYEREQRTINFYIYDYTYTPTTSTSNSNTYYGLIDGEYIQLTSTGNGNNRRYTYTAYEYVLSTRTSDGNYWLPNDDGTYYEQYLYYHNGQYYKTRSGNRLIGYTYSDLYTGDRYDRQSKTVEYTGTRYTRSNSRSWNVYKTITGLYGQTFDQAGVSWPTEYDWYDGHDSNSNGNITSNQYSRTTFLDGFTDAADDAYYGKTPSAGSYEIRFYKQNLDGSWGRAENTIPSGGGNFTFTNKYQGFTISQYRIGNGAWQTASVNQKVSYSDDLEIRFTRNKYDILFLDKNDNPSEPYLKIENVPFGADLSEYASTPLPGGDEFTKYTGWNFSFANATMPAENLVVYANREQKIYNITVELDGGAFPESYYQNLNPNAPDYEKKIWAFSTYFQVKKNPYQIEEYEGVEKKYKEDASGDYVYILVTPENQPVDENGDDLPRFARYVRADQLNNDPLLRNYADCVVKQDDGVTPKRYAQLNYQEDGDYKFMGWYEVLPDGTLEEYNFNKRVDHDITLRAVWVNTGAKYKVQYMLSGEVDGVTIQGTKNGMQYDQRIYTDSNLLEKSPLNDYKYNLVGAPTIDYPNNDAYVFEYWDIGGVQYYPGDEIEITEVFDTLSDGVKDHVITVRAVYARKENSIHAQERVHLWLHPNPPDGTTEQDADVEKLIDLQVNQRVELKEYGEQWQYTGYMLIGWSTEPIDPVTDETQLALPEGALFFHRSDAVGADLNAPIGPDGWTNHLYAVWKTVLPAPTSYQDAAEPFLFMTFFVGTAFVLIMYTRRRKGGDVDETSPL